MLPNPEIKGNFEQQPHHAIDLTVEQALDPANLPKGDHVEHHVEHEGEPEAIDPEKLKI